MCTFLSDGTQCQLLRGSRNSVITFEAKKKSEQITPAVLSEEIEDQVSLSLSDSGRFHRPKAEKKAHSYAVMLHRGVIHTETSCQAMLNFQFLYDGFECTDCPFLAVLPNMSQGLCCVII